MNQLWDVSVNHHMLSLFVGWISFGQQSLDQLVPVVGRRLEPVSGIVPVKNYVTCPLMSQFQGGLSRLVLVASEHE